MIYGITLDSVDNIDECVEAIKAFPVRPWVRIVFDLGTPAQDYVEACKRISEHAFIVGEILDSFEVKKLTPEGYKRRTKNFQKILSPYVDVWEVGNEINGDWLGKGAGKKCVTAHEYIKSMGGNTLITLYLNEEEDGAPSNMFTWAKKRLPESVRHSCDYVSISWYEDDNKSVTPNWNALFDRLGLLFPNSELWIGEFGAQKQKNESGARWAARTKEFLHRYYSMRVDHPRFNGGWFFWYGSQWVVPKTKPMHAELVKVWTDAIRVEKS